MKKRIKKYVASVLSICILSALFFSNSAYAMNSYHIYEETEALIKIAIEQYNVEESYIGKVKNLFETKIRTTSEDLNTLLRESIENAIAMKTQTNEELEVAMEQYTQQQQNTKNGISLADIARAAYLDGVALVSAAGCPQTAAYMLHAMLPIPISVTHDDDDWARSCAYNQSFTNHIFPQFEEEILATGKSFGSIEGSFTYTQANSSLDHHMALHNVRYVVTFTENSNGNGYSVVYNITDVYDFDWTEYDGNIAVNFGNNYCYAMQQLGLIHPFSISIITEG